MRWGLCATGGCYHTIHCDSDGVGTVIEPICGVKIWFIAVPKDGAGFVDFASIDMFDESFDIETPNEDKWDIEVIVLKPGMRL